MACREVNLNLRTWRRWLNNPRDQRPEASRSVLFNCLSPEEETRIRDICHRSEYASQSPSQIVPWRADKGIYLASESTFYRELRRYAEIHRRGRQPQPQRVPVPTTFTASAPCQVWAWDITWCVPGVQGEQGRSNELRVCLKY